MDAVRSITGSIAGAARPHSPRPHQGTVERACAMIERVIEGEVIDRRQARPGFDAAVDGIHWRRAQSSEVRTSIDTGTALAAYRSTAGVVSGPSSTGIDLYA